MLASHEVRRVEVVESGVEYQWIAWAFEVDNERDGLLEPCHTSTYGSFFARSPTRQGARAAARAACQRAGRECTDQVVQVWQAPTFLECAAMVAAEVGISGCVFPSGYGRDAMEAQSQALQICEEYQERTGDCEVRQTVCFE